MNNVSVFRPHMVGLLWKIVQSGQSVRRKWTSASNVTCDLQRWNENVQMFVFLKINAQGYNLFHLNAFKYHSMVPEYICNI